MQVTIDNLEWERACEPFPRLVPCVLGISTLKRWGNMPALDLLQLAHNEGQEEVKDKNLSLAFIGVFCIFRARCRGVEPT